MAGSAMELLKSNAPTITYAQALDIMKQQRMIWFALCFGVDIYDTYLHQYPSPDPIEVAKREDGAFAKYEGLFGRLCWMGLSYGAWGLLMKKNFKKAEKKEKLTTSEIACIASIIGGFALRIYCKYIMGKRYTYSIVVYKDHEIQTEGPYQYLRHPGMFGMLLNLGGTYSWLNHWWGWAVYALCVRDTYVQIEEEEECLKEVLGDKHDEYIAKVPSKLIPFIW